MSWSTLKKGLLRLLLLLLLYFLQADVFPHLRVLGVCPLPLPLAAVAIGLFEGGLTGGLWGLLAGVLCDLATGNSFAFTLLLCCAGFFAGFLGEFIMARSLPSLLLLGAVAELLSGLILQVPVLLAGSAPAASLALSLGVGILYSLLFTLLVYPAVRGLSRPRRR